MECKPHKIETRNVVRFYDLSPAWQAEAISNLGKEEAEDQYYIEPLPEQTPDKHYLRDFSNCVRLNDSNYDGGWQDSNCCWVQCKLIDGNDKAILYYFSA
jgi:hypothetical protein